MTFLRSQALLPQRPEGWKELLGEFFVLFATAVMVANSANRKNSGADITYRVSLYTLKGTSVTLLPQ